MSSRTRGACGLTELCCDRSFGCNGEDCDPRSASLFCAFHADQLPFCVHCNVGLWPLSEGVQQLSGLAKYSGASKIVCQMQALVCCASAGGRWIQLQRERKPESCTIDVQFLMLLGIELPVNFDRDVLLSAYVVFCTVTMFFFMLNFLLAVVVEGYVLLGVGI